MADNLGDHPLKLSFWRFLKSTPCWVALQSFHGRRGRAVSFPTWAMYLWLRKSTAGSPNVSAEGHQHLEDPQHCHFRSRLMPQKRIFREVNIRSCRTSYITYYKHYISVCKNIDTNLTIWQLKHQIMDTRKWGHQQAMWLAVVPHRSWNYSQIIASQWPYEYGRYELRSNRTYICMMIQWWYTICLLFVYVYVHTYMHACIHACMHACIHAYIHASMHPCIHASIHPYIHTSIHPYIHTSIIHTYIHIYIHTYITLHYITYIHTYIHYIHTYIHTIKTN